MLTTLLKDSPADFSQTFDELVVVPDGILWYLPFEALQVTVDGQPQSLISRFHIRYAPTLSLCTPQGPARNAPGNTAVVVGKLYPHDADGVAKAAFEQISGVVAGAVAVRTPSPAPSSIYGTLFHRLIVLDDLVLSDQDPYGWILAPIDKGKTGATLADWLTLPWGGPRRRHPARLPHRRRRRPETPAPRLARQRSLSLGLRTDGQRRARRCC